MKITKSFLVLNLFLSTTNLLICMEQIYTEQHNKTQDDNDITTNTHAILDLQNIHENDDDLENARELIEQELLEDEEIKIIDLRNNKITYIPEYLILLPQILIIPNNVFRIKKNGRFLYRTFFSNNFYITIRTNELYTTISKEFKFSISTTLKSTLKSLAGVMFIPLGILLRYYIIPIENQSAGAGPENNFGTCPASSNIYNISTCDAW
jgi:hypothetical protein